MEISVRDFLSSQETYYLIDVREPEEFIAGHIPGAHLVSLQTFLRFLEEDKSLFPHDQPVVVYCAHGIRGGKAVAAAQQKGFTHVSNLTGGYFAWVEEQ